jgi:MSHA biogenesis protein MshP
VSVIFILVVLALLGAALAQVALRQQLGSAAEVEQARALQTARAGLEWAAFQVLTGSTAPGCFAATSLNADGLAGYTVTVNCTRSTGTDGAATPVFYTLVANACNAPAAGACPSTAAPPSITYVERQLSWTVVR